MKGRLGLLAVVVASLAVIPLLQPVNVAGQEATARFRVLVPEFQGQPGADRKFGERLAEQLRERINDMATHQPIQERELRDALRQYDLDKEDLDCTRARQLAGLIDAQVVFCGTYTQQGDDITTQLRMFSADGAEFELEPTTVPRRGGQRQAADHYYQALELQSEQARRAQFCGDYANSQNWEAALDNCNQAIQLNPNATGPRYTRASVLREVDRYEEALEEFLEVLELDPLNEDAMQNAGWLSAMLGNDDDARMYYSQYLELNPANAAIRMNVAYELAQAGDPVGAMEFIEEGLELDPENVDLLKQHGGFAFAAGAEAMVGQEEIPVEAVEYFRKALDSYGQVYAIEGEEMDAGHLRQMIVVHVRLEEFDQAAALAEQALETHSDEATLWSVYADALQRAGRVDEAIEALNRVAELDPEANNVRVRQGNWLLQAGRVDEAVPVLQEAVARGEQTADAVANIIWANGIQEGVQKEDWPHAMKVFRLAKEIDMSEEMTQQVNFWLGYAILKVASVRQEPGTLETAQQTLPRFQEALGLLQSAAGYAQRANQEQNRQNLISNVNTYIEIQEAIIRRGR